MNMNGSGELWHLISKLVAAIDCATIENDAGRERFFIAIVCRVRSPRALETGE